MVTHESFKILFSVIHLTHILEFILSVHTAHLYAMYAENSLQRSEVVQNTAFLIL